MTAAVSEAKPGAWGPMQFRVFRALWIAALVSSVGTWMQQVGAVWVITSLTSSPVIVALLETAGSLPLFLLALPAGALGDVMDRRKYLIASQGWMFAVALVLAVLTLLGHVTPWLMLAFTFALGIGAGMNAPVWQAIFPELVPAEQLPSAIALVGIALNVARAVGPAAGGALLTLSSPGFVFLLNAFSFLGVIVVLVRWRRAPSNERLPPERVGSSMRAGVRYVRNAPEFRIVLLRTALFIVFGSGFWALLPVVGRGELGLRPLGFGILVGTIGLGSVATASVLPRVRTKLSTDALLAIGSAAFALAALTLAFVRVKPLVFGAMLVGGAGWITIMSSLSAAAQATTPQWVRARALAVYALVFQGGTAVGSAVWGAVSAHWGVGTGLATAALGVVAGAFLGQRFPLGGHDVVNTTASPHWPQPVTVLDESLDDRPLLITIEYAIAPENAAAFLRAVRELESVRRRYGAFEWGVYQDASDPGRYVEEFEFESWNAHMRQHERVTEADREVEERVRASQRPDTPVRVRHLVSVRQAVES